MTRRLVLFLLPVAVAVGLVVGGFGRAREPGPGEALLAVNGRAIVVRADGHRQDVTGVTVLGPGDRVTVVEGIASLDMAGDTRLEGRAGSNPARHTDLQMGVTPTLLGGDLLVEAVAPITLDTGTSKVAVRGSVARVRRAFSSGVSVYSGQVAVASAGRELPVPALREAHVSAPGRVPARPRPLRYDSADLWDRRYLGDAIDLSEELRNRARAYTASVDPGDGRTPGFYAALLPQLAGERSFDAGMLDPARTPGETLVGAAITVLGDGGSFSDRWDEVFGFRDDGAAWGLVALDQQVDADPLRAMIDQALSDVSYQFAAPASATRRAAAAAAAAAGDGGAAAGTAGTAGTAATGPGATGPGGTGPGSSGPGGTGPGGTTPPPTDGGGGGGTTSSTTTTLLPTTLTTVTLPPTTTTTSLPLPTVTTSTTIRLPTTLPPTTTTTVRLPTTLPSLTTTTTLLPPLP